MRALYYSVINNGLPNIHEDYRTQMKVAERSKKVFRTYVKITDVFYSQ